MPKNSVDRRLEAYQIIITNTSSFAKNKVELLDLLADHDIEISERALQSYLKDLRNYGVEFEEKRDNRVVYYKLIKDRDNTFLNFLEHSYFQNQLVNKLNTKDETHIYRETDKSQVDVENIRIFAEAILNKQVVTFQYNKFDGFTSHPVIHPYLMKEYNGFWYVLGGRESKDEFVLRTYAVDRMNAINVDKERKYNKKLSKQAHRWIKNVIGVSFLDREPQEILLQCDSWQWKYLQVNPLHHSQLFLEEDDNTVTFKVFLVDNYELRQMIYWYAGRVKVIAPEYLKKEIKFEV